ncbi:hypothetical protein LCGC14_2290860 [marine sediment metagenome]|uniref:Permuted papain-like amidase enzyme, YaeF/YiiX, C92 family n=1 Tax=marine sediment metagenome TaxID=412755 RepID=A0A0F9DDV2_9ZZZZ
MMRTMIVLVLGGVLAAGGCGQGACGDGGGFVPRSGDLLFQDLDLGPLCDAIERVTTGFGGTRLSHVGIVADGGAAGPVVIEAISRGVVVTPLGDFLGRSRDVKGCPKVAVGRLQSPQRHLIRAALEQARALTGKPYDKVFAVDNDAYYCSELIYTIFLRANDGAPVFTLQPMTFKDPDTRELFPAWRQYFAKLAVPVPEGQPGINPGGISRSAIVTIVHVYGELSRKH